MRTSLLRPVLQRVQPYAIPGIVICKIGPDRASSMMEATDWKSRTRNKMKTAKTSHMQYAVIQVGHGDTGADRCVCTRTATGLSSRDEATSLSDATGIRNRKLLLYVARFRVSHGLCRLCFLKMFDFCRLLGSGAGPRVMNDVATVARVVLQQMCAKLRRTGHPLRPVLQ